MLVNEGPSWSVKPELLEYNEQDCFIKLESETIIMIKTRIYRKSRFIGTGGVITARTFARLVFQIQLQWDT